MRVQVEEMAAGTASRLRLVQASFADEEPAARREQLTTELERVVQTLPPSDRRVFLQLVAARFPSWQDASAPLPAPPPPAAAAPPPPPAPLTPDEHLEKLLEAIPLLDAESHAVIVARLLASGLKFPVAAAPASAAPAPRQEVAPSELEDLFRGALGLPPGTVVKLEQVAGLLQILNELLQNLEKPVRTTWDRVTSRTGSANVPDYRRDMEAFVAGRSTALPGTTKELRRLILALIAAIGKAPGVFAIAHRKRISADEIQGLVKMEGKPIWKSWEQAYWDKYRGLSEAMTAERLEKQIMDAIAETAESIMRGLGH